MDYKCRECGEYFDKPRRYTDWVECWGHDVPMYSYTCPNCDGEDYDDAYIVEREEEEREREMEEEEMTV